MISSREIENWLNKKILKNQLNIFFLRGSSKQIDFIKLKTINDKFIKYFH